MEKICGVYKIINSVNQKVYLGCSINCNLRKIHHFKNLKSGKHPNPHLQSAYSKYGKPNFTFEVIERCNFEDLFRREHYWCSVLLVHNKERGYNIRPTCEDNRMKISEESREKRRITMKGRKNLRKDYIISEETRRKISETLKGRKLSQNTIEKQLAYHASVDSRSRVEKMLKTRESKGLIRPLEERIKLKRKSQKKKKDDIS